MFKRGWGQIYYVAQQTTTNGSNMKQGLIRLCLILWLSGCIPQEQEPVIVAINPWPGYELLYLAEKKGFFKQVGANVQLYQLDSLTDVQFAYINGNADGLTGTLVEAVQSQVLSKQPLKIVMVPDYSNGGDVIIAEQSIDSLSDLKGKNIGCEVSTLGIYFLQRALHQAGLTLSDVKVVNVLPTDGYHALSVGSIDALVAYPPASVQLLKNQAYRAIFSSADIPKEIIDVVLLSQQALTKNPQIVEQLHQAWDLAINEYLKNPSQAAAIMAGREQVGVEDFMAIINSQLVVMDSAEQRLLMSEAAGLQQSVVEVCRTLVAIGSLETDCESLPKMVVDF